METKSAIILVAGEGKRLRPFTLREPKCFAAVGRRRILDNALEALATAGCREVTIVVGHLAARVQESLGSSVFGMRIRYVENSDYATTNSMYSLNLGLRETVGPTWVLEGDIFLEPSLLELRGAAPVCWYVDSSVRALDGAFVTRGAKGEAIALNIVRDLSTLSPEQCKSTGILRLTEEGAKLVKKWLERGVEDGRVNDYYDLILGDQMPAAPVEAVDVSGRRWFEIDDADDLATAEELFA